jgi:hypothetical protein
MDTLVADESELYAALEGAITDIAVQLKDKVIKGSISDLARLYALRNELKKQNESENIREVKVTWVDAWATESGTEK